MTYSDVQSSGGLMARFDNLAVKTKIFGGFGIVLAILAVLGGVSYFSAMQTDEQFDHYAAVVQVGFAADDVESELLTARRFAREYALAGHEDVAKKALEAIAATEKTIAHAAEITTDADRAPHIKALGEKFATWKAAVNKLIEVQTEHQKQIRESLDVTGQAMRVKLAALRDAAAQSGNGAVARLADETTMEAVRSRLSAYRYLGRQEQEQLDELKQRQDNVVKFLKQLNGMVAGSSLATPYETALTGVEVYIQSKDTAFAALATIDEIVNKQMLPLGNELSEAINTVQESADKELATILASTQALLASVEMTAMLLSIAALVIGGALAWIIGRGIASGIIDITGAMRELAGGNKAVNVPYRTRKDEVGAMAAALQVFKDTAIEADRLAAEQKIDQEKRLKRAEQVSKLVSDFNDAIRSVVGSVSSGATQLKSNAQSLSAIAEETNRQSVVVSSAAEEASRSVESVASAAEELNASIGEINRQIEQSATLANEAVIKVKTTNETVETLSAAAQEIGNVVQLIQDIAAQTNLLALNATIEAARAGEAGKGFAVVASEVKTLANQTAKATEDISAQIARIQTVANQSVEAMGIVGKGVAQISDATTTVASAAQEQGAATAEISRSIQQVSAGTTEVATNITEVTKAAGETGQMAAQVLAASNDLNKQSETLQKVVGEFIEQVKAA